MNRTALARNAVLTCGMMVPSLTSKGTPMLDQLVILAESGSESAESIAPYLVGGGFMLGLLVLLWITYLFGGLHQHGRSKSAQRDSDRH